MLVRRRDLAATRQHQVCVPLDTQDSVEYYAMTDTAVRDRHDRLAGIYDRQWSRYIEQTLGFLKSWIAIPAEASVLDIGCGTGHFERIVLKEHPQLQIVGVDLSERMLEIARRKNQGYPNVRFLTASASSLPFPDEGFDVVVSASALHYFSSPYASLAEMRRVVKPRGDVVILDWCKDYLMCKFFDAVFRRIEPSYHRCYAQREFHRMLVSTGFEIRAAKKVQFDLVWGLMVATATPIGTI
jgi:ubiquinone/menaquinone biosynthesis C-methylase UbiE